MALPAQHLRHQGRVLAALGNTAWQAALRRVGWASPPGLTPGSLPGPELTSEVAGPPAALVRDYLRFVGGDPAAYRARVPAHLFPHWGMPLAARTLQDLDYPLLRVVNGGCRLQMNAPLPLGERLRVRARLMSVDDDGRRAVLRQRVVTGTAAVADAVVADIFAIVRLGEGKDPTSSRPQPPRQPRTVARVSGSARELAFWRLRPDSGLGFALLTGDFNPIHWVRPYARAMGHRSTILHGFATLARTIEGLNRGLFSGATDRLSMIDVRFTRPLVLPSRVGLYVDGRQVAVGDAPGGPAYLTGQFAVTGEATADFQEVTGE